MLNCCRMSSLSARSAMDLVRLWYCACSMYECGMYRPSRPSWMAAARTSSRFRPWICRRRGGDGYLVSLSGWLKRSSCGALAAWRDARASARPPQPRLDVPREALDVVQLDREATLGVPAFEHERASAHDGPNLVAQRHEAAQEPHRHLERDARGDDEVAVCADESGDGREARQRQAPANSSNNEPAHALAANDTAPQTTPRRSLTRDRLLEHELVLALPVAHPQP